ncbi:MAG: SulP family inorganic anion transporter [Alphaproteobacteria bacterium]|nr:SulP family inorganic anion transporter [Alphaproteobacteria bacterium]
MQIVHGFRGDNIRGDIYGGLTAAVVALPLALAFGVASGAGPIAGLYGAIAVGFFAAIFGGTPSQISGPTGPMTVVMAAIVTQYAGNPAMAFTVVMLGGLLQILFGVLKLGRYINLMPFPVISGFMSGIGFIIIILQFAPFLGQVNPPGGPLAALLNIPALLADPLGDAVALGAISLAIVFLMPASINRLLPSPLVALGAGTLLALYLFTGAPILADVPTGLPSLQMPTLTVEDFPDIVGSALVLAVLGSLDSLLTSLIADNTTRTNHESDRELIGQGIGNMIAGLIGGLPGAGATMRTIVNVRAGGRTPISGALHAIVLLAVALGLAPLAEHIPHAVLAGILFKVGIDIIDWDYLRRIRRAPRVGVLFMLIVLGLTVFVDLIVAVAVGVVMASLLFVKRMADLQNENIRTITGETEDAPLSDEARAILKSAEGRLLLFHLGGPMSFGVAKGMGRCFSVSNKFEALVFDLTDVPLIDSSASLALRDGIKQARADGRPVFMAGARPVVEEILDRLGVFDHLPAGHRFANRAEALRAALDHIGPGERS